MTTPTFPSRLLILTTRDETRHAVMDRCIALGLTHHDQTRVEIEQYPHICVLEGASFGACNARMESDATLTSSQFLSTYLPSHQATNPMKTPDRDYLITTSSIEERRLVVDLLLKLGYASLYGGSDTALQVETHHRDNWDYRVLPYVRTFTCDNGVSTFDSTNGSSAGEHLSATAFLAQFGPPSAPAGDPPNFIVDTYGNAELSRIVQELAIKVGVKWTNSRPDLVYMGSDRRYLFIYRERGELSGLTNDPGLYFANTLNGGAALSAATDMGRIVELLSKPYVAPRPPAPVGPRLHGHVASYAKGDKVVKIGCANVSLDLLNLLLPRMGFPYTDSNRSLASVTSDKGETLTMAEIRSLLDYTNAVETHKA